ncbi:M3 family metallopeptidase [Sporotomaculum syntrophicum]|uniref:M3 family metallopeptidase n=1 Tax=Sporotomaculum syntrophicum TaxID=182264 RepID=UPI00137A0BE3|nr:M3 family metallopeptidase [Sporotomaculum syntrophicum]
MKYVYENCDRNQLTAEQKTLLENTYRKFARNGAELGDEEKERLRRINRTALSHRGCSCGGSPGTEPERLGIYSE